MERKTGTRIRVPGVTGSGGLAQGAAAAAGCADRQAHDVLVVAAMAEMQPHAPAPAQQLVATRAAPVVIIGPVSAGSLVIGHQRLLRIHCLEPFKEHMIREFVRPPKVSRK